MGVGCAQESQRLRTAAARWIDGSLFFCPGGLRPLPPLGFPTPIPAKAQAARALSLSLQLFQSKARFFAA